MRNVRHALLPAVALVALIVGGCGSDNKDKKGQASTPAPASTAQTTAQGDIGASLVTAQQSSGFRYRGNQIARRARAFRAQAAGGGPSTYCSPTGDYCVGVGKRGTTALLSIASLAFKGTYRLCLAGPGGHGCKAFPLRRQGQMYVSTVAFTPPARGRWTASWFYGSTKLGKSLGFSA